MLLKNKVEKVLEPVDMKTGIELLEKQIEEAEHLLDSRSAKSRDYSAWNEQTAEFLTTIYGEGSPNIDTIVAASGEAPVWLFMPDDVVERSESSCLENKIKLLEGCVVALRRKIKQLDIVF